MSKVEKAAAAVPVAANESRKPFEIHRSDALELKHLQKVCSAMFACVQSFAGQKGTDGKTLSTMGDVAYEYGVILQTIDDFYKKSRGGIGQVKVYLVAESTGFTKQMEISIKGKD